MYHAASNKRVQCRALNITEELGQVQHIFCDKTGTLTENQMLFMRCTIGGLDYAYPPREAGKDSCKKHLTKRKCACRSKKDKHTFLLVI